jgi:hypothetical protein
MTLQCHINIGRLASHHASLTCLEGKSGTFQALKAS